MQQAADELEAQRAAWVTKGQLDFGDIAGRMQGLLILKFEWVWEPPYTVWQVGLSVVLARARSAMRCGSCLGLRSAFLFGTVAISGSAGSVRGEE